LNSPSVGYGLVCFSNKFGSFTTQFGIIVSFPLCFIALLFLCFTIKKLILRCLHSSLHHGQYRLFLSTSISFLGAIYFPLITYIADLIPCSINPISGISYLTYMPYVECHSISYGIKIFILIFYGLGISAIFVGLPVYLSLYPSMTQHPFFLEVFGDYYLMYKGARKGEPGRAFAGVVLILRKSTLAVVFASVPSSKDYYPLLIISILSIHLAVLVVFKPFRWRELNRLSVVCLSTILLLFAGGLVSSSSIQFPEQTLAPVAFYVLVYLIVILAIIILWKQVGRIKGYDYYDKSLDEGLKKPLIDIALSEH